MTVKLEAHAKGSSFEMPTAEIEKHNDIKVAIQVTKTNAVLALFCL
ncbi:hypothetical protein RE474_13375 [Methanolobus sediminis]|uniref:Uncharacterized protein n=1 Tax=Methanolobus sediminis TaxID=3072978 RepID=A0AA51UL18_9EURY|nr:hypothetical protein [Methanolobus sediminis]WMW25053.1 hypothetical protein RE474_13375 [Methanolobus sediminis]